MSDTLCGDAEVQTRAGTGSKRVSAPCPLAPSPTAALLSRQLTGAAPTQRRHRWDSLSHLELQQEWDLYSPHLIGAARWWPPFYLRRRSPVREVVADSSHRLVVALADSGVCVVFDQDSGEPLCFVNTEADECVRSVFLNRLNGTLITVSVFSGDASQQLHVRATPLSALRGGRPHAWRPLFGSEVLRWPGFVEFDDVNDVAVTFSAEKRAFKVYDLHAPYHPRFWVDGAGVQDIKVASGGVLLLTLAAGRAGELALRVLDLRDGTCLKEITLPLEHAGAASSSAAATCSCCGGPVGPGGIELVELFGKHLLIKESGGPLRILDIDTGATRRVPAADFPSPAAFIHLPFNHAFLAFWQTGDAQLWSFDGRQLASLAHASLPSPHAINTVFVNNSQDLIWVYCPPGSNPPNEPAPVAAAVAGVGAGQPPRTAGDMATDQQRQQEQHQGAGSGHSHPDCSHLGCIRVYDLVTGRQAALVQEQQQQQQRQQLDRCRKHARLAPAAAAALKHLTSLFYDEHSHRLYTGTGDGRVQTWAV